jgi:hypothetical protein
MIVHGVSRAVRYSRSSEKDSKREETPMRVVALALHFSELYQNDEVRSLGEKSRLQPQIPVSGIISGTVRRLKGLSLLGIFGTLDRVQPLSALNDGGGRGTGIEPSPR